jgi:hypothetical protein
LDQPDAWTRARPRIVFATLRRYLLEGEWRVQRLDRRGKPRNGCSNLGDTPAAEQVPRADAEEGWASSWG